jgi:hypothetical protein
MNCKKVYERRVSQRELTTWPDLRRLTRQALQVAELLPWPDKSRLFQVQSTPFGAQDGGGQVFWRGQS